MQFQSASRFRSALCCGECLYCLSTTRPSIPSLALNSLAAASSPTGLLVSCAASYSPLLTLTSPCFTLTLPPLAKCQLLKPLASSINTPLHERLYDFTGASTFVATTLYSLFSSHPDAMQRLSSLFSSAKFHDPFLRNVVVTAAVIAWAIRCSGSPLIADFAFK